MNSEAFLGNTVVIPVVVIDDVQKAAPLAQTLLQAGLGIIEVTLRTSVALAAIEKIRSACPDILVGAGSVIRVDQVKEIQNAGASFAVSPGSSHALLHAVEEAKLPYIPGSVTASEVLNLLEFGYTVQKFFPAEQAGGAAYLKSISGPIADVKFVPTGGVNLGNAEDYLKLSNVQCLGGSWIAPARLLQKGNFEAIGRLAADASRLRAH